jgi:hypothetical protein
MRKLLCWLFVLTGSAICQSNNIPGDPVIVTGTFQVINGNASMITETNSFPMFDFKSSPDPAGRFGRLGIYGATGFSPLREDARKGSASPDRPVQYTPQCRRALLR